MKSISLNERDGMIRQAFYAQYAPNGSYDAMTPWVLDVYDDHLIATIGSTPLYWRVEYQIAGTDVTFAPRESWQQVEREYVAVGSAIKTLGEGKLGGHLVVFGDENTPDLEGDYFTKSTDFGVAEQVGVYYLHGLDGAIKKRRIGVAKVGVDDVGVWVEAQLDMRDAYEKAVYDLAARGKLGWSSGSAMHLVEREREGKSARIVRWPLVDASLTPSPAEPRARAAAIKTLSELVLELPGAQPEGSSDPAGAGNETSAIFIQTREEDMNEDILKALQAENGALKTQLDALGEQLSAVVKMMEDAPALKGYTSVDGGGADKSIKSMGDWLLAVMRGDERRLATVYSSTKATLDSQSGALGGYTVPYEYSAQFLTVASEQSVVYQRVKRIPVTAPAGEIPALDQYFTPTAGVGQTAAAGKLTTTKRGEGASYTETNPEFEVIRYRLADAASGLVKVSKELRADSILSIETLLRTLIGIAVGAKIEQLILRGTGVNEPLGILNAPAKVSVSAATTNTFAYADATKMVSQLKAVGGQPIWVIHPGSFPDVAAMQNGSGGPVWLANLSASSPGTLLGYPLEFSEHIAQPDNADSVVLADLSGYVLFEKGGLYIDFSEHAAFTDGKDTWRFGMRCDGQPWVKNSITLGDPQGGFKVSPFVVFAN